MMMNRWLGVCLAVASLAGIVRADDGHTGNQKVPSYFIYPKGADLKQTYDKPAADSENNLTSFAATAPGTVSPGASASVISLQPNLTDSDLAPLADDTSRITLATEDTNVVGLAAGEAKAIWRHSYRLQHKGVPLSKFSTVSHVVEATGTQNQTLYIRSRNIPKKGQLPATKASVKPEAAEQLARADAKSAVPNIEPKLSKPRLEVFVKANGSAELVWAFTVQAADPAHIFAREYWVSAQNAAKIVHREDQVYLAEELNAVATGKVTGRLIGLGHSPLDPPDASDPLQDYSANSTSTTNSQGIYTVGGTLKTKLSGPFAVIDNKAGALLAPQKVGNDLFFNAQTEAELAQTSAFFWVNFTHEFARPYLPANPTILVNNPVRVNINQTCNAFWSSADHSLNFFKSGGGCANSAYCDVVCHEFGHGIDTQFGGIIDGGYSEGFGDSVAILITHSSIIGKDFLGKGKHLRDAKEVHTWPPADTEVHEVGKIYGGFTWQLTRELMKTNNEATSFAIAKDLVMGAAALNPKDTPDAVKLSFFVDSKTGSKHFKELAAAADSRKIPRPKQPVAAANAFALLGE